MAEPEFGDKYLRNASRGFSRRKAGDWQGCTELGGLLIVPRRALHANSLKTNALNGGRHLRKVESTFGG